MSTQEVVLKKVPSTRVASVRDVVPTYADCGHLIGEVYKYVGRHRARPAGPSLSIYYDEGHRERDVDVEAAVPVAKDLPSGDRVKVRELPAVEEMVCIVHEGSYDTLAEAYTQLMTWIEANGYRICGPNRAVWVKGPRPLRSPSKYVTEIQFPVEKV